MPNHVAIVFGCLLLGLSFTAQARDPAFAAQAACRGAAPCKRLKPHLKRLSALQRGKGRQAIKARFVRGSVLGYEALRVGDRQLAGRSVEVLKPIARRGASERFADDALVLIARLRLLRGLAHVPQRRSPRFCVSFPKGICVSALGSWRRAAS